MLEETKESKIPLPMSALWPTSDESSSCTKMAPHLDALSSRAVNEE
jgi:hypothetical protein